MTHEGAADVADLLDRRTRVGLVPADRALVEPLALRALAVHRVSRIVPCEMVVNRAVGPTVSYGTIPAAMSSHGLAGRYEGGRLRRRA